MTKREIAQKPRNPFIYEGYEGPDYFCVRSEETERLISHLQNGVNVTLISSRKMGKTGLIKHAFHHIKETNKDAVCIYSFYSKIWFTECQQRQESTQLAH